MCGVIGGFPIKKKKITNENKSSFDSEFNNVLYSTIIRILLSCCSST
jgi:hypothetical protein